MANRAETVKKKCNDLKAYWKAREEKFTSWYEMIQMVDELQQNNMESFVGNEPRAAFNLVRHMLDTKIPHRIRSEDLDREMLRPAAELEKIYNLGWRDIQEVHRARGREGFLYDFIGFLLATGWYAVFAQLTPDGKRFQAEVWNPATVFQSWDNGLVEVAHIFPLTATNAMRMADRNKWVLEQKITTDVLLYDHWTFDDKNPWNEIVLGNELVKSNTKETRFNRIPIFTSPAGGLPDDGIITKGTNWRGEIGQTSLATNEYMIKQFNKWWTFMMQLLRDTSQPRTFERTAGGAVIIREQDKFRRGAHFKLGPQDEIGYMVPPPIPLEIRSMQLDIEAGMQKGGPPNALYGATTQQLTSFVMSQIAASAHMIAKPFHRAVIYCLSDMDNFYLHMMKKSGAKPYGLDFPKELPDSIEMTAEYELRIPGDAATRATYSRMLNPDFRISKRRVFDEFWPEISNPIEEMALITSEDALNHPSHAVIALIQSYREQARLLKEVGDNQGARLYEKAATMAEAQLFGQGEPQQQGGQGRPIGQSPDQVPRQPRGPAEEAL